MTQKSVKFCDKLFIENTKTIPINIEIKKKQNKEFKQSIDKIVEQIVSKRVHRCAEEEEERVINSLKTNEKITKVTIDKTSLNICEDLSGIRGSDKTIDSNTYRKLMIELMSKIEKLKVESKLSKEVLNGWENRYKHIEEEIEKSLKEIKQNNWCNVCLHKAVEPYQCCRDAHYCSYVHIMGDKTHFIYCQKNKRNEYTPPPPEPQISQKTKLINTQILKLLQLCNDSNNS